MFEELSSLLENRKGCSVGRLRSLVLVARNAVGDNRVRRTQVTGDLRELGDFFGVDLVQDSKLTPHGLELARIAGEFMEGLERFSVTVKNRLDVRIGAGDRLIHWILLPRLAQVQSRLPTVHITLFNLQTPEVIKALKNRSIDLGLIRTSALIEPLRAFPLQTLQYGFFVPMKILERLPPEQRKNARYIMENAPVAVQGIESEIHTRLRDFAQADNVKLNIKLCCESYPQSFRAIASDGYCGFLPLPAEQDLDPIRVIRLPTPFLSLPTTEIALVHHPDLHELLALPGRPSFQSVITCFERVYRDSGTPRN